MKKILIVLSIFFLAPIYGQHTSSKIYHQLLKLGSHKRVLYMAAHPDDENTRAIAYFSNAELATTGYLSLTRGDGGQNLIGDELGRDLGLIRTHELLAARQIDGGRQFFTRAIDFGYSKSPEETFEKWDEKEILGDVVRVIRSFKPDIIITRFPPDSRAGHGHHTASAQLAIKALSLAGDSKAYKAQIEEGLKPHQASSVYWNTSKWWGQDIDSLIKQSPEDYVVLDIGGYDPVMGISYNEWGTQARSQHKSQGFGVLIERGSRTEYFKHLAGEKLTDGFFQESHTWVSLTGDSTIENQYNELVSEFSFTQPEKSIPGLLDFLSVLKKVPQSIEIENKISLTKSIIFSCLGLYVEAISKEDNVVFNESFDVKLNVLARNQESPVSITRIYGEGYDNSEKNLLVPNQFFEKTIRLKAEHSLDNPFWLNEEAENMYTMPSEKIGKAVNGAGFWVGIALNINDHTISLEVPVERKWGDRVEGEQRQDVLVSPAAIIKTSTSQIFSNFEDSTNLELEITAQQNDFNDVLTINTPDGWEIMPSSIEVRIPRKGEKKTYNLLVKAPPKEDKSKVAFSWRSEENVHGIHQIRYSHLPKLDWYPKVNIQLISTEIIIEKERIGYIMGAGDLVPECLKEIGYQVELIGEDEVKSTDLSVYTCIITGIRAYNVHSWLGENQTLLNNYVADGGKLIVQYNTSRRSNEFVGSPIPMNLSRKRVTEEDSKVKFIDPKHPVLHNPYAIRKSDFEGWVQERGLYFADDFSSEFSPILSWHDRGEAPQLGGLIVAEYGKGQFIYTGISFFRQLPAGVPGAYRLFINLISYE